VNAALLSRSQIFQLYPLTAEELRKIARIAIEDSERGLGKLPIKLTDEALEHLIRFSDGDARRLLNALELAAITTEPDAEGNILITLEVASESIQRRAVRYDKNGDNHYDTISAFIKSIRGSDPDAAVYWLARMLDAGEDPKFIARRLVIHASEDIGNADPQAIQVAVAAFHAVDFIGLPECRLALAQAATYLASAPKSNASYVAINRALEYVRQHGHGEVPLHLKDSSYKGAKHLGHGTDYLYPHDYPGAYVDQRYLPEGVEERFYHPVNRGYEKTIKAYLDLIRSKKKER
jgi:putative ATPase